MDNKLDNCDLTSQHCDFLSILGDFVVCIDRHGLIQYASEASKHFLHLPNELLQESINLFIHPEDRASLTTAQESAQKNNNKQSITCRLLRQNALPVWIDCHIIPQREGKNLLIAFDATHWKNNEAQLVQLSTHDTLTGLPNRILLNDRINTSIHLARRDKKPLTLILLALNGFNEINNTLGHVIGDELIKAVAVRLQENIRNSDTLARIGGNGFCLFLLGTGEQDVQLITKKILLSVQRSFFLSGYTLHINACLGAAIYPENGNDAFNLYRCAELAMQSAKLSGNNHWQLYDEQINVTEKCVIPHDSAMHEGIKNGEFKLHYQPVFCAQTGKLKGAEALIRWESAKYGTVSPIKFIPLAENNGLITTLGAWALRSACYQAKQWQQTSFTDLYMSVNISPRQFSQTDFLTLIKRTLSESDLSPEHLMLEITEGVLMDNPQQAINTLNQLRDANIGIAVDNFGTGYSSLAYLKRLPLTVLKIDKLFTNHLTHNNEDMAIINAIIRLAKGLGLTVVAEGVEDQEQLDLLKQSGCNLIQGYLMGRPVNPEEFSSSYLI